MHLRSVALRGLAVAACLSPWPVLAHGITAAPADAAPAPFDIVETTVMTEGDALVFTSRVRGEAGSQRPEATGNFAGAGVHAYVWPTSLNSSAVGFEADQGIVALAATFHPDFDDGASGAANRDVWHAHWVVLGKDDACPGGLKVQDIPEGATPRLPPTWPGVPLLIDSPDYPVGLAAEAVSVRVPRATIGADFTYDGVTAGLRVDANLHAPLLCVTDVFKVVSGDLSLPGTVAGQ